MADTLQEWFNNVPLITKILLVSTFLSGAALSFRFLDASSLVLIWGPIKDRFQVWRLFTPFILAGSFSFNFAIHLLVLYENCKRYESNPYDTGAGGNTADFLWMLLLSMAALLLVAYVLNLYVLSEPLLYVILYVWSRREPDTQLNIWGFRFKSLYLPWVYIAIRLIMGGAITEPIIGIAVGHLYYFLVAVMPVAHGRNLIRTPAFCSRFVHWATGFIPSGAPPTTGFTHIAPPQRAAPAAGAAAGEGGLRYRGAARDRDGRPATYNWGSGHVLGTS